MPKVIALKDGRVKTLFEVRHFEDLIDRYMGYEAVQHFRELMAEKDDEVDEVRWECTEKFERMEERINELEEKLEERDCDKS